MFFKNLPNFFYPFFIDFLFTYHLFLFIINSISAFSLCRPYRSFFNAISSIYWVRETPEGSIPSFDRKNNCHCVSFIIIHSFFVEFKTLN